MSIPSVPRGAGVLAGVGPRPKGAAARKQPKRLQYKTVMLVDDDVVGNLLADGKWPVRDQNARGTCNAFAMVAAEELARHRKRPHKPMKMLSEEHFYAAIRKIPQDRSILHITEQDVAANVQTGATYLLQVKDALVQFGLCTADLLPYQPDAAPNSYVDPLTKAVRKDAAKRRLKKRKIVHNIMDSSRSAGPPHDITWLQPRKRRVSSQFIKKLRKGVPVVAAFAIVSDGSWLGYQAEDLGQITYNVPLDMTKAGPAFGHTVCIVGFQPPASGDHKSGGWFLFRNSWGTDFAKHYKDDPFYPRASARGYGYIRAVDVDTYCWEYLYRKGRIKPKR